MYQVLLWTIFSVFTVATIAMALYGLHLYVLLFLFRSRKKEKCSRQKEIIDAWHREKNHDDFPWVTTQIPIYNEQDVARRIIEAVVSIDYPPDRHEIQVLDDSDDDTSAIVDQTVERLSHQYDIKVVRRDDRKDYKAGALWVGMRTAKGKFVAIFDADFIPPADFLHKAIPLLKSDEKMACLQGRWGHLNRSESWLTEAQALGIDGHFAIEQGARAWNGLMMNFNGTAGIWRKEAIEDPNVGGWSGDTLTEDLDLSYRAQLAGWKLDYCLDLVCPAELPNSTTAFKSQQRRWATGSIQVARKLLPTIWRSPISISEKVEATLHLTHYSVACWMLILALIARPLLLVIVDGRLFYYWFGWAWLLVLLSAVAPSMVYTYARFSLGGRWSGLRTIPSMFVLGCGMCVNNSLAVFRGLTERGGEFVRTPKSGSEGETAKASSYQVAHNHMWVIEIVLGLYSAISFVIYFNGFHRIYSVFLLVYAMGFLMIGILSRPRSRRTQTDDTIEMAPLLNSNVAPAESASGS